MNGAIDAKSEYFQKTSPEIYKTFLTVHRTASILSLLNILQGLSLGLSHLCGHKFKLGFLDSLNPICSCGSDIETTCHFFAPLSQFYSWRITPLVDTTVINTSLLRWWFTGFGDSLILNGSVDFILSSKRFDGPLLQDYYMCCK